MKTLIIILFTVTIVLYSTQSGAQHNTLLLTFDNRFGNEPLSFEHDYTNAQGEQLRVTLLNYYISNIQLMQEDGTTYTVPQDSSYFLVRHNVPQSRTLALRVPDGKYTSVKFVIGVDSLRSTQGAASRKGVLDVGAQARGMYWQWNSGYIFFKMEGKSPASPDSLKNNFYYHIGGYGGFDSPTLNNIRVKAMTFEKPVQISARKQPTVRVGVDIKQFFEGDLALKIGTHPSIMWGPVSTRIADQYVHVFSFDGVSYSRIRK
jgi:hypothetical protein